jgi:putative acetyltransferase
VQLDDDLSLRPATNADCDAVKRLVFGVLADYDLATDTGGTDADLDDIEGHYLARGGVFEVVEGPGGEVLGTIGLYPLDEEMVELRKMYFLPSLRGRGLGRRLLERMIAIAKQKGYRRIYLETASRLEEAVHLYESVGFRPFEEKHTPRCDQAFVLELGE